MSSAGQESREWRFYVTDMIEFGEKIRAYTSEMDQATFVADALTYDATLRNLELIGEAATCIPSAIRDEHPEIPWRAIIGARNRLAHAYLSMDDDLIWTMIQDAIPKLLPALRDLLDTTSKDPT
jgi:uncharacterized protein with HEPN domain